MASIQAFVLYNLLKIGWWQKKQLNKKDLSGTRTQYSKLGKILLTKQPISVKQMTIKGINVDVIYPEKKIGKFVIYIHGGGYTFESTPGHYELMNRLAVEANVKIFAINYKLAPEYLFPTQLQEVSKVYQWLIEQGYKPNEIFFAGDSAGANIALGTTLLLRDQNMPLPHGLILVSPPTDATFSYKSFVTNEPSDVILTRQKMTFFLDCYRGKEIQPIRSFRQRLLICSICQKCNCSYLTMK